MYHRDESDIETQLMAEQDNSNLQENIEKLQKELSICRAQFEQATAINKKIENIHNKNQKLTAAVRNLQSEKDELTRRLEISMRANDDLESKLNEERLMSSQQCARETAEKEREMIQIKSEFSNQLDLISKKMDSAIKDKETQELQNKITTNKIDKLLQNSNQFFGLTFTDIDSLIDYLSQPPLLSPQQQPQISQETTTSNPADLEKKNKSARQKLKESRRQCEKLLSDLDKLQRELQDSEKKKKSMTDFWQNQIDQLKDEHSTALQEANENIQQLISNNQKLKTENQKIKSELKELRSQQNSLQTASNFTSQGQITIIDKPEPVHQHSFKEEFESVSRTNIDLEQKLQNCERRRDDLSTKVKKLEDQKMQLEVEIEKQKHSLNALQVVHDETVREVATLRESLHSRCESHCNKNPEKKLSQRLKEELDKSAQTIQQLSQQLHELQLEKESERHQKETIENKYKSVKGELDEAQFKISSLNDEISEIKEQVSEKPQLTADDLIPIYAWRSNDFDPALAQQIEKVITNQLLQPASKLNNVYKVIIKYYNEIRQQKLEVISNLTNDLQNLKNFVNKFTVDTSILLSMNPITVNDFLSNQGNEKILSALTNMMKDFENLKRRDAYFSSFIEELTSTFGNPQNYNFALNPNDFHSFIVDLKTKMDTINQKLKIRSKKLSDLKNLVAQLKRSTDNDISIMRAELNENIEDFNKIKAERDLLAEMNQKLKRELSSTKYQLTDLQHNYEEKETAYKDQMDQALLSAQTQHNAIQQNLKQQVEQLLADKESTKSALENHESSIERLRNVIESHQKEINEKNQVISTLTTERDSIRAQTEEKCRQEKEQLIKSYEKAVKEIRKQCDNHRVDLEKASTELADSEKKYHFAKETIVSLKREKIKLESDIKSLREQMKRDKQLSEADTKTKILQAESNYASRIQDNKNRWENERKRIFAFAADEFRQFFNPSEAMDERAYKSLLARIKKELDKLSAADQNIRRLVLAGPHQPTDEAVAQMIMHPA